MDVNLTGKNMVLDTDLEDYARRKFGRLARYQSDLDRIDVTVTREATREVQSHFSCRANVVASGRLILHVEERAAEPRPAMDTLVGRLEELLTQQHGFTETNRRLNAQGQLPPTPEEALVEPSTLDLVLSDYGIDEDTIAHLKESGILTMEQLKAAVEDGRLRARLGSATRDQVHDLVRVVEKLRA